MFTAALYTIPKMWKQPKCPSIDEWIKMWNLCNNGILPSDKNKEIWPFVTSMDLESIMLSVICQTEKGKSM